MKNNKNQPLLADMHYDGVRFDPKIVEALRAQKQYRENTTENARRQA